MEEFICFTLFVAIMLVVLLSDESTKRKIRKFDKRLTDFENELSGKATDGIDLHKHSKGLEYGSLETMLLRLYKIEACVRCRYRQRTMLKDKEQTTQEGTKLKQN